LLADYAEAVARFHAIRHRPTIVVAGGGVAGLEALMALRALLGGTAKIDLVAPEVEFSYRPIAVAEPFGLGEVRRYELARVAADHGAHFRQGTLAWIDTRDRTAITHGGDRIAYDYLVVAIGAHPVMAIAGALTFGGPTDRAALEEVLASAERGTVRRLVFAAPPSVAWVLPLYELALFTAAWARKRRLPELELSLVTFERGPLEAFGSLASDAVARLLSDAGVALHTGLVGERFDRAALVVAGTRLIPADVVIALPRLEGPRLPGLPHDEEGFIPTDRHGAVRGIHGVYAAGDGTDFPIKQGGLAAQQADAVAAAIAAELGVIANPEPFRPVLRGLLLTGREPRYLRASADTEASEVAFRPLWWPPGKIAGRHIAPYLARPGDPALVREPLVDRPAPEESEVPEEAGADEHEAVELLLELADANASRGSFDFALRCLAAAEEVGGPLPAARQRQRHQWEQRGR
jgi:sulfide:quinone oxidoreductase